MANDSPEDSPVDTPIETPVAPQFPEQTYRDTPASPASDDSDRGQRRRLKSTSHANHRQFLTDHRTCLQEIHQYP